MSQELVPLDISTMCLGGVIEEANKALAEAIGHCERHPGITKARTVKIEIQIEPEFHEETGEYALNINHYAIPVVPKTYGRAGRAAKRNGTYQVVSNPQFGELEANQISIAEHLAKTATTGQ